MKNIKYLCTRCYEQSSIKENEKHKICPNCGKKLLKKDIKPPISKFKQKVWNNFSKYIRLRDCIETTGCIKEGRCYTCKNIYDFDKLQAGHMVDKRSNNILFDEDNVKAQCISCNIYKHGNQGRFVLYRIQELIDKEGLTLNKAYIKILESFSRPNKELTYEELIKLNKYYLIKIKELEKEFQCQLN